MSPDDFRRHGRAVVDWIADYMERVETLPVLSRVQPGDVRAALPPRAPDHGEPFETLLRDVDDVILPGITHWQSPNFFAYFPANASGPSMLGDLLASGLGVQGMLWITSPACTELEMHVLDWLVDAMDLPDGFRSSTAGGGVIQDTASSATLCALLAARERATGWASNVDGVSGRITAYASSQAHSALEKAMMIAGLGRDQLRVVDVDERFAMRADRLDAAIARDLAAGARPCLVVATTGTTSSGGLDPLAEIAAVCRRRGTWLHVDAAWAGTAALCPELRFIHDGLEHADSYCFNPHKWMFTNFDWRFRALKLWFVLRHYGLEGLRHHVREHVRLARRLADLVRDDDRFELAVEPTLALVCFRHVDGDDATRRILDELNASGRLYLSHTKLGGRMVIRFSIGQTGTEERHVEQAWKLVRAVADGETVS
jgi:aromatic-L-amino-acid decarboxylase